MELASQAERLAPQTDEQKNWADLGVCEELQKACKRVKWTSPTAIQTEAIPWALKGRDIVGLAETGSGKTGAFALPILETLLSNPSRFYALVLAPTRELCVQIGQSFEALGASIELESAVIVGGLDMVTQAMQLAKRPHVVVASPGRLVDHLENTKGFHLRTLKYLVLDEADRMLSMDFEEALDKICQVIPRHPERQSFLFSATMTSKVTKLQRASLHKPVKCEVNTKYGTVKTLVQNYMFIPWKHKQTYFCSLLLHYKAYASIVFVDTCLNAQKCAVVLRNIGVEAIALHGNLTQPQRLGALNQFKGQAKKVLVATDVASRGLDIPQVDLVVNFDIPKNSKDYIHRVGRTARAGRSGRSVTLVTQYDIEPFQRIEKMLGQKLIEFKELEEKDVMALHEKVIEAVRVAEVDSREDGEGGGKAKVRKIIAKATGKGKKKMKPK
jgi:ATP-dependent RNA helicase DDX47/RRP3